MDKLNRRERKLIEKMTAVKEVHSPATVRYLSRYLALKHKVDGGLLYIISHRP